MDDLVQRLRAGQADFVSETQASAADRIEVLEAALQKIANYRVRAGSAAWEIQQIASRVLGRKAIPRRVLGRK